MRFRAEQRLRRQADFKHARTTGRRYDAGCFTLWYAPRPAAAPDVFAGARIGVVASTAAVGNAIARARAKRRMRELFRAHQSLLPPGHDVLMIARAALNRLEYREIEQKFVGACRKIFPPSPHA